MEILASEGVGGEKVTQKAPDVGKIIQMRLPYSRDCSKNGEILGKISTSSIGVREMRQRVCIPRVEPTIIEPPADML